ncbi:MAG: coproporphyrinogen III oxidase [Marinilabiliales bacterium]|nr:MAG: coproporphyrinogen III oxidase [Marinilabiliales bacterium]
MAGIYIHIPYCKQKCHYCNFYSFASTRYRDIFVESLLKEITLRKDYLTNEKINTIYFGGGTPSTLNISEINDILKHLYNTFDINEDIEITLEANPDDMDKEKLSDLKNYTDVNRLSIGVQSFFDDDLVYLNRVHNSQNAIKSIELAKQAGFENMTIDLIYGIPGLTEKKWRQNLKTFFDFNINHLSSYSLTVEPKTALNTLINKKKIAPVVEEESIKHFDILLEETEKNNFIHYEISNFAHEGYYSKHNSIYWMGAHYAGFGPSAHSFNGKTRQWNVANMKQYIESDTIEKVVEEEEVLTIEQRYNEYIMTSLRTKWGCDTVHIENIFGEKYVNLFEDEAIKHIEKNNIIKENSVYKLTKQAKIFADGIASDFFIFNED